MSSNNENNVVSSHFGTDANPKGALFELANRSDIRAFIIVIERTDGQFEHIRIGMQDLRDHCFAAVVAQRNLGKRIG